MKKFKQINGQLNETSKSIARAVDKVKLEENKLKEQAAECGDKAHKCSCRAKT